jgi:hypothetical protein
VTTKLVIWIIVGLAFALSGSMLRSCSLKSDVKARTAEKKAVETERDAFVIALANANKTIIAERKAHSLTRGALGDLRVLYSECTNVRHAQEQASEQAIARLDEQLRDANATLTGITARFKAATRDPECAICVSRPICAALRSEP